MFISRDIGWRFTNRQPGQDAAGRLGGRCCRTRWCGDDVVVRAVRGLARIIQRRGSAAQPINLGADERVKRPPTYAIAPGLTLSGLPRQTSNACERAALAVQVARKGEPMNSGCNPTILPCSFSGTKGSSPPSSSAESTANLPTRLPPGAPPPWR